MPAPTIDDDAGQGRACALELDGVRAGLLDEADRVLQCLGVRDLERAERHVGDHERPPRAARHRARQHDHLVHRRGDGGVVAEDGHRRRVAHEDEVGAGLVGEAAGRRVVRRDHDDRLAACLHAGQLGDGELAGGRRAGRRGARACAHDVLLQWKVVDQAGGADADRGGERGRVERCEGDVVDLQAGCVEDRPGGLGVMGGERPGQRERSRALLGGEADVARREREPVGVADGRHDLERELEVQVGDHPAEHLDLLRVLLPEEHDVRPDDGEQLEADRRHGAEVARAVLALEHCAELGDLDPGLVPGRVELGSRGREDDVHTGVAGGLQVARLVPRVAVEVGGVAELRRVHEEAHHHRLAGRPRLLEERPMAVVERAHRRHEPDAAVAASGEGGARVVDRTGDDHAGAPCETVSRAVSAASAS